MKINIDQLSAACEVIARHLTDHGIEEVEVPWDYYWNIPVDAVYNPLVDPTNLDLGQLSDDWPKLLELVDGSMPPVGCAFTWLAAVARAVGELAPI